MTHNYHEPMMYGDRRFDCTECRTVFYIGSEDDAAQVNGEMVCPDCVRRFYLCTQCSEPLTDQIVGLEAEDRAELGPTVWFAVDELYMKRRGDHQYCAEIDAAAKATLAQVDKALWRKQMAATGREPHDYQS